MLRIDPRQSRRSNRIEERCFLRVCLHAAVGLEPSQGRADARVVLDQLAKGIELAPPMRSQVPLFADGCARLGVLQPSKLFKRFTALALREQRRNTIIMQERARVLAAFEAEGIVGTEIRGPAIGLNYYPAPNLRHTHALRWAVFEHDALDGLIKALLKAGWQRLPAQEPSMGHMVRLGAASGTELVLYNRLVPHVSYAPEQAIMNSIEFQVAAILCQAHFEQQQQTKRWICDLSYIFANKRVDEERVAELVSTYGMAGSCAARFREMLTVLPFGDRSEPGRIAAAHLQKLELRSGGPPRDSTAAKAALRCSAPPRRGRGRRALGALRRGMRPWFERG
ncbi:hypothetical protein U5922_014385 [Aquicoccus sp. G2-2]|uniref:hypothetical protein n=1 Tax=Aquicoccus sp. G2-2 TaxID=3092120 RepID=UPI002AE09B41|nr:hypothetical protein [Aquicoccus sp. G2-2]MEA1114586.1 hypothetical protein [Aquicoccus sp. G2-2]